jgi:hypothetical protein
MRILALAERAFDNDALLRLPLYSRSRSNDSDEKAEWVDRGVWRRKRRESERNFERKQNRLVNLYAKIFDGRLMVVDGVRMRT